MAAPALNQLRIGVRFDGEATDVTSGDSDMTDNYHEVNARSQNSIGITAAVNIKLRTHSDLTFIAGELAMDVKSPPR